MQTFGDRYDYKHNKILADEQKHYEEWTNTDKAERAANLCRLYDNLLESTTATDILADIMRLCDGESWDFEELLDRARRHHAVEAEEDDYRKGRGHEED